MADSPKPDQESRGIGELSYDAIALKAYFIALDRHARGEEADPLKDWLEAERQMKRPRDPSPGGNAPV